MALKDTAPSHINPHYYSFRTMSTETIFAEDFSVKDVTFGAPKALDNGGRNIPIYYKGRALSVQLPVMRAPFGLGQWPREVTEGVPVKYDISVQFSKLDTSDMMKAAYRLFSDLDAACVEKGFSDSMALFKKKATSRELVQELYTSTIRFSKDKNTGEINTNYEPTINLKLPFRDGHFQFPCYNNAQEEIDLRSVQVKGAKVMLIVQCSGIWVAGPKFGCSWKVKQMQISPPANFKTYAFKPMAQDTMDDDDEIDDAAPKTKAAVAAAPAPVAAPKAEDTAMIEESDAEEDAEDAEEEEEEEVPVVPVKKTVAKKAKK